MSMAVHQLCKVVQNLRKTTFPDEASVSDSQLLSEYIEHQDEWAFAALVKRHSSMVWGVCRRIVAHHQSAEDAFQATFLVLAQKANSIRPREMLANWLFGVAQRTALKARTMSAKRSTREKQVTSLPEPEATGAGVREDLEALLDQELASLPDKYRVAIVLCDLEGRKGKVVAKRLQIPEGTLASRLRAGRIMLAKRLARQGVALSGGALATIISQDVASAAVPPSLVGSTIHAATLTAAGKNAAHGIVSAAVSKLMDGMVKSMLLTKLKTVLSTVLAVNCTLLVTWIITLQMAYGWQSTPSTNNDEKSKNQPTSTAKNDVSVIQATGPSKGKIASKAKSPERGQAPQKRTVENQPERSVYPVLDLILPLDGLVTDSSGVVHKVGKTKEDWLINMIKKTVAPKSWEGAGGKGTIEFFALGKSLLVFNTPRVHAQVKELLETMRRVQAVQLVMETRIVSVKAAVFQKLQETSPHFKNQSHAILGEPEWTVLVRTLQKDADNCVLHTPKVTSFSGQKVSLSLVPGVPEKPGVDLKFKAFVAADLQQIELDVNVTVGKTNFAKGISLEDGQTLAQFRQVDENYVMVSVTPRVLIVGAEEMAETAPQPVSSSFTKAPASTLQK
jgi:RNA polymerase sigma factor (sigma-70 family)